MEKITSISQLKKGDKIWTINTFSGAVDILEFVCIHPHNEEYSIFLNENYDGMPKFYNKHLADGDYERYDASKDCWERIHAKEIAWHERRIQDEVKSLMKRASDGGLRVRDFVRGDFPTPEGLSTSTAKSPSLLL